MLNTVNPKEASIMKLRSVLPMKIAKYGYIVISAVFCIVGILFIVLPEPAVRTIELFIGISMIVFGAVKLVGYFSKDLYRLAFQYDFQFGILMLFLGIIALIKPGNVINFICISLGICILADCLFKAKIAFEAKQFGIREWWLTLVLAVITGIIGIVLTFRPSEAVHAIMIMLGISLLAEGILNLSVACSLVKIVKHQKPDVIDVDYYE